MDLYNFSMFWKLRCSILASVLDQEYCRELEMNDLLFNPRLFQKSACWYPDVYVNSLRMVECYTLPFEDSYALSQT